MQLSRAHLCVLCVGVVEDLHVGLWLAGHLVIYIHQAEHLHIHQHWKH